MTNSSENILLSAVLTRELLHINLMMEHKIASDMDLADLITIKTYLEGRLAQVS